MSEVDVSSKLSLGSCRRVVRKDIVWIELTDPGLVVLSWVGV